MREALPIFCQTSAAYADAVQRGQDARQAASEEWTSTFNRDREDREVEHLVALGGELSLDELLEIAPEPDERGDGWPAIEASRLGRMARRLWDGLLSFERVSAR